MINYNELTKRANLCEVDINNIKNQLHSQKLNDVKDQRSISRKNRLERDLAFLNGKIEAYKESVKLIKQGEDND